MKVLVLFVLFLGWTAAVTVENKTNANTRILGGRETHIKFHKHLVQLRYKGFWICGGILVSKKHVVTAQHCLKDAPTRPRLYSIKAGSTQAEGSGGKTRQVIKMWLHPRYKSSNLDYDIAVLKLANPIEGAWIKPISLGVIPLKAGQQVNVAGWGMTRENGFLSNTLRAVFVPVVAKKSCTDVYYDYYDYGEERVTNRMICAGNNGKNVCFGDSGGPMVHGGKLYGIVSWGYGCIYENYPGVYADVLKMKMFINSKLKL